MNWKKALARTLLPESWFEKWMAVRARRYELGFLKRQGLLDAAASFVERNGLAVRYGPFAGMLYPRDAALTRHSIPKLLGTYEQELHPVISSLAGRRYDCIIDIGCAEGYYAVGLAKLLRIPVLAFDPEPVERALCSEAARLNDVAGLVELRPFFHPADIPAFRGRRVLCICDCEGFESRLFHPATIPQTASWDLLIELHGSAAAQLPAYDWPHKRASITSTPRRGAYVELQGLGDPDQLISEYRPSTQTWLWCESR